MERENIESIYSNYVFTTVSLSDVAQRFHYIYAFKVHVCGSERLSQPPLAQAYLLMCYPAQQGVISINVLSHF